MPLTPNPPTAPPDYKKVPKGIPPNPMPGSAMDWTMGQAPFPGQPQPPPETYRFPHLENPGITNVSGQGLHAQPEVQGGMASGMAPQPMAVPSPVSALDPAYTMHPIVKALGKSDVAGAIPMPSMFPSSWMQSPLSKAPLKRSGLLQALGFHGLQAPTETQGNAPGIY